MNELHPYKRMAQDVYTVMESATTMMIHDDSVHKLYADWISAELNSREDLVIDFDCLQMCLDPQSELSLLMLPEEEKVDYRKLLVACLTDKGEQVLPKLRSLRIRNCSEPELLFKNILQLTNVTELDLVGVHIPAKLHDYFQFWSVPNVTTLKLDKTKIAALPPSIGRLAQLEHLSLSNNNLKDLPVTLSHCQRLSFLDLHDNNFSSVPAAVIHLRNLRDLRRLQNPLADWPYAGSFPHINVRSVNGKHQGPWSPDSLQSLVSARVMTAQVNYWEERHFPPLQCRWLDSLATQYKYCENCQKSIPEKAPVVEVTVMLMRFLGLHGVPFKFYACSDGCKERLVSHYTDIQKQLKDEIDREYDENVQAALKAMKNGGTVDISPNTINAPADQVQHFTAPSYRASSRYTHRSRRKKCTIM